MKKWIRWWGLGVFAAIVGLWVLCIDWIVEHSIEFAGTQAMGAKVELDSAELSLRKGYLQLDGLQVTNPEQPMQNLIESSRIHMGVDLLSLFRRQFISDEASIDGLSLYTERKTSGAIDGRLISFKNAGESTAVNLGSMVNLPDVQKIADDEQDRLKAEVAGMQDEVNGIKTQWEQRVETLPNEETVEGYKRRWKELKQQNVIVQIQGAKELRDDINKDLKNLSSLEDQIKTDKERVTTLTQQAKTLPKREADRLLASVGLDKGFEGMIRQIVGDQAFDTVKQGLALYKSASAQLGSGGAEPEEQKPQRGTGEMVRFAEKQPLPEFLIKKASVNGAVKVAGQTINFDGVINDITNEQAIWGKPMTLKASGNSTTGASLNLDGLFDHRSKSPLDSLNLDLKQLALTALALSKNPELPISLEKGLANIKTSFAYGESGLDVNVESLVRQAQFLMGETGKSKTAELLGKALTSAKQFDLNMVVKGELDDPNVKLKSSLDNLIGDVLGAEVKAKVAEQKQELQAKFNEVLQGQTTELSGSGAFLDEYKDMLAQRREELKALLKDFK